VRTNTHKTKNHRNGLLKCQSWCGDSAKDKSKEQNGREKKRKEDEKPELDFEFLIVLPGPSSTLMSCSFCQRLHFGNNLFQHIGKAYLPVQAFEFATKIFPKKKKHSHIPTFFIFRLCGVFSLSIVLHC
jgi:hypothetical protein